MRVSRIAAPVTVLGPGRRAVVWVQGCSLACDGCASQDTWSVAGGLEMSAAEVAARVVALVREHDLSGLTLSGGEPFQQASDLAEVVRQVREACPDLDVLAFSGYGASAAARRGPELHAQLDVLVAGRYDRRLPAGGPLLASANQELIALTPRGVALLGAPYSPGLQVAADGDDLFVVGLPRAGDLERLTAELATRGVALSGASWR